MREDKMNREEELIEEILQKDFAGEFENTHEVIIHSFNKATQSERQRILKLIDEMDLLIRKTPFVREKFNEIKSKIKEGK